MHTSPTRAPRCHARRVKNRRDCRDCCDCHDSARWRTGRVLSPDSPSPDCCQAHSHPQAASRCRAHARVKPTIPSPDSLPSLHSRAYARSKAIHQHNRGHHAFNAHRVAVRPPFAHRPRTRRASAALDGTTLSAPKAVFPLFLGPLVRTPPGCCHWWPVFQRARTFGLRHRGPYPSRPHLARPRDPRQPHSLSASVLPTQPFFSNSPARAGHHASAAYAAAPLLDPQPDPTQRPRPNTTEPALTYPIQPRPASVTDRPHSRPSSTADCRITLRQQASLNTWRNKQQPLPPHT